MNLSINSQSQVPPGFRFHPTEEELLHYYLRKKIASDKIDLDVIGEVDLNKLEPWDIQGLTPQNDWYFFSHKDKKYPTGTRTNRATAAGFWKATGRDRVIYGNCKKIGMRKTLVFYKGRAPHGLKLDWIMHEYRLDDNTTPNEAVNFCASESTTQEEGWVVCRVFKKKNYHKADQTKHVSNIQQFNNNENIQFDTNMQISSTGIIGEGSFLHLPELEIRRPTTNMEQIHQDCSFDEIMSSTGTDQHYSGMNNYHEERDKKADWVALDRLVASQLNGHL